MIAIYSEPVQRVLIRMMELAQFLVHISSKIT
jgi:hypothetical protein